MTSTSDKYKLMTKPVVVTIEHRSTKPAVKARIEESLGHIRGQLAPFVQVVDEQWTGDALQFRLATLGQTIAGSIAIDDRLVRVEVMLPGLLGAFGRGLAQRIERQGTLLLEKK